MYIPLQFWFCRNPGLALPLIALQYHEVKINVEFRSAAECYNAVDITTPGSPALKDLSCCMPSLKAASLYVDYIYLDTDERRRFAQVSHEYLIEQLQFTGDESVSTTSNKIKLNFNPSQRTCAGCSTKLKCWYNNHMLGSVHNGLTTQTLSIWHIGQVLRWYPRSRYGWSS